VLESGEEPPIIATAVASFWWRLLRTKYFSLSDESSTMGLRKESRL